MITLDEFSTITAEILSNSADVGAVSERLDKLRTEYAEQLTAAETNKAKADDLTKQNESLRAANMALFLKTGEKVEKPEEKPEEKEKPKTVEFSELFGDNGELL